MKSMIQCSKSFLKQGPAIKRFTTNACPANDATVRKGLPPPNDAFVTALSESRFTIFRQLSDLVYYDWNICGRKPQTPLASQDVWNRIRFHQRPLRHAPLEVLRERTFHMASTERFGYYSDTFPQKQPHIANYGTALKCGMSNDDIDFMFFGPAMGYLTGAISLSSFGGIHRTFVAEVIPGTNIVAFSSRGKPYFQNLQSRGFQFERFAQQLPCAFDRNNPFPNTHMHVQFMRIDDTYNALSCSQIDAMDPTGMFPVEIKTHRPMHSMPLQHSIKLTGRKKALWQLISTGAPYLIAGEMELHTMTGIEKVTMDELADKVDVATTEARLMDSLHQLRTTLLKPEARAIPHRCVVDQIGISLLPATDLQPHFPEFLSRDIMNESTVEQIARKLKLSGSVSSVEDQFRLLGTRIAVGRLVFDSPEKRAAVLLQQSHNVPWKSVAAILGVKTKDIKKLEALQHTIRNHLQRRPAELSVNSNTSSSIKAGTSNPRQLRKRSYKVEYKSSTIVTPSTYAPQILPTLVLRLSGFIDDPNGAQHRAQRLLALIHQMPVADQRAHLYELRRYAAAYEVAALIAIANVPVDAAVQAAETATRMEVMQVLPRVKEAFADSSGKMSQPARKQRKSNAGIRMADALRQKQKVANTGGIDSKIVLSHQRGMANEDDAATWAFTDDGLDRADMSGSDTGDAHIDLRAWKKNVLDNAVSEYSSIETAALEVLKHYDLSLNLNLSR